MKEKEHQENVNKLTELETELIKKIAEIGDQSLMNCFERWQKQRTKCNESYMEFLNELTSDTNENN